MSDSDEQPISASDLLSTGRAYWLPPFGYGNGLDALFWAQLAREPHPVADGLLRALASRGIPGWVAPVDRHHSESGEALYDVWTATVEIDAAEDVVMAVLNAHPRRSAIGSALATPATPSSPAEPDPPARPSRRRLRARARSRSRSEP